MFTAVVKSVLAVSCSNQAVQGLQASENTTDLWYQQVSTSTLHDRALTVFKKSWNPFARKIVADYTDLQGPHSFFKADKHSYFVAKEETPFKVTDIKKDLVEDYAGIDLQSGKDVVLRNRAKHSTAYTSLRLEQLCNDRMGKLVHEWFKDPNSNYWLVTQQEEGVPLDQVLKEYESSVPRQSAYQLFRSALLELKRLNFHRFYLTDLTLNSFVVDPSTSQVTLTDFKYCQFMDGFYYKSKVDHRRLRALFSPYLTIEDFINAGPEEDRFRVLTAVRLD